MTPTDLSEYLIRPARPEDAVAVAACVDDAYGQYVARIGYRPGPMTEDYDAVIGDYDVTVVEAAGRIVAVLVVTETDEGFLLENVAVAPAHRGTGLGRHLLEMAEAQGVPRGVRLDLPVHARSHDREPGHVRQDRLRRLCASHRAGPQARLPAEATRLPGVRRLLNGRAAGSDSECRASDGRATATEGEPTITS